MRGLANLRDGTVLDGEVVALDEAGRPQFNALQNFGSAKAPVFFYVFDVLVLSGRGLMSEPLSVRRAMLERDVLPYLSEPVRHSPVLDASVPDLKRCAPKGLKGSSQSVWTAGTSRVSGLVRGRRCGSIARRSL